jgi:hypothetical protein
MLVTSGLVSHPLKQPVPVQGSSISIKAIALSWVTEEDVLALESVDEKPICYTYASPRLMSPTIRITSETRERLSALKFSPGETYDELLNKLLSLVPESDDEGKLTDGFRLGLLNAKLDIVSERVFSHGHVKKRLSL